MEGDGMQENFRVILSKNITIHCLVFVRMAWQLVSERKLNFPKVTVDSELFAECIPRVQHGVWYTVESQLLV